VLAGRTTITNHGGGAATVEFRSVTDDHVVLSVEMLNSERVTTTATRSGRTVELGFRMLS